MIVLLLYFVASFVTVCSSHLSVSVPLDEQLPLIARVDQPYVWTFYSGTFGSADGLLTYSTSSLPLWLSFNPANNTFYGTPSARDEGNPEITVTAKDSSSSVSSTFALCVTPYPPPTAHLPITAQFHDSNPSLSSVFLLAPNSAVATINPAVRVPPRWSFSIGFQWDTFTSSNNLYYEARLADGSVLPPWMIFNPKAITLNGVVPSEDMIPSPMAISLALLASDQEGYTACSLPFDLIVASHELSVSTLSLPTINITASTPFNVSLSSPADFSGILVDGKAIQPSDIANLSVDTSAYKSWLKYDAGTRTLSGTPESNAFSSGQRPLLPVALTTSFNQSIRTNLSLALVPSYFSSSELPLLQTAQDRPIVFNLVQYFSNITDGGNRGEVNLTAAFEPDEANDWLKFDPPTAQLTGTIPDNFVSTRITVAFTAYSHVTHSTSHANLPISVAISGHNKKGFGSQPGGLSTAAHAKLVLGLGIAFGVIGGLCAIGGLLAAFRHCAKVEDTALGGEAGRNAWSDQDKKWYGHGLDKVLGDKQYHGYGWTEYSPDVSKSRNAMDLQIPFKSAQALDHPGYGILGLELRRVSGRHSSSTWNESSPGNKVQSPGVMRKREFITRIKDTVRNVSGKYAYGRRASPNSAKRPVIGKPILISSHKNDGLQLGSGGSPISGSSPNPFDGPGLQSDLGSTIMTNSPSASTAEHSIPRRRADFAPPRSPVQVHFEDVRLSRQPSMNSTGSLASDSSARTHAAEAVVQTASKATSIRSGRSASGFSHQSAIPQLPIAATRPRLVPFTSATRVPVPHQSSHSLADNADPSTSKRIASQTAKVWKLESAEAQGANSVNNSGSGDELSMGLHYVRSLGADKHTINSNPSTPTLSTNVRSSFSSLESSHQGHNGTAGTDVMRMLVRIGEKFKFRVPVPPGSLWHNNRRKLEVRLTRGNPVPKFLHVDMSALESKAAVALYGMPEAKDVGVIDVGLYNSDGVCVARVVIEVVGRS